MNDEKQEQKINVEQTIDFSQMPPLEKDDDVEMSESSKEQIRKKSPALEVYFCVINFSCI